MELTQALPPETGEAFNVPTLWPVVAVCFVFHLRNSGLTSTDPFGAKQFYD